MNKGSLMLQAESNRDQSVYSPLARLTSVGNIVYPFMKAAPKVLGAKMRTDRDNIKSPADAEAFNKKYHKHVEYRERDNGKKYFNKHKKGHN